jgi:hypothetical protein
MTPHLDQRGLIGNCQVSALVRSTGAITWGGSGLQSPPSSRPDTPLRHHPRVTVALSSPFAVVSAPPQRD